jgi:hypothetical protein
MGAEAIEAERQQFMSDLSRMGSSLGTMKNSVGRHQPEDIIDGEDGAGMLKEDLEQAAVFIEDAKKEVNAAAHAIQSIDVEEMYQANDR